MGRHACGSLSTLATGENGLCRPPGKSGLRRNPTVSFSAAAKTAGSTRVDTLTVAGIPFTITQSACNFGPSAGSANVANVQLLINQALGKQSPANDLNKDGVVNVVDIQIEIDAVLGTGCAAS
jgi:hypothetical protein